jgi:hypothetical protein
VGGHYGKGLCASFIGLNQVDVHFITIEVSVVGIAISVMHAESLLLWQNTGNMSHNTGFMESRLAIDK